MSASPGLLVSSAPAGSSVWVHAVGMERIWSCSRKALVGSIGGMGPVLGSCSSASSHWGLGKSWTSPGRVTDLSSISGPLPSRNPQKPGNTGWKRREQACCLRERFFLRKALGWGFSQVQYLLGNTSHLPPFLSFSLELTAESWGKPSNQQLVFLSHQEPGQSFSHCGQEAIWTSAGPLRQPREQGFFRKLSSGSDRNAVLL